MIIILINHEDVITGTRLLRYWHIARQIQWWLAIPLCFLWTSYWTINRAKPWPSCDVSVRLSRLAWLESIWQPSMHDSLNTVALTPQYFSEFQLVDLYVFIACGTYVGVGGGSGTELFIQNMDTMRPEQNCRYLQTTFPGTFCCTDCVNFESNSIRNMCLVVQLMISYHKIK